MALRGNPLPFVLFIAALAALLIFPIIRFWPW